MKGISKYVNDTTRQTSSIELGVEYKGILSNKMSINQYLIKEQKIHFNDNICRNLMANKEQIKMIIYKAINEIKYRGNGNE